MRIYYISESSPLEKGLRKGLLRLTIQCPVRTLVGAVSIILVVTGSAQK